MNIINKLICLVFLYSVLIVLFISYDDFDVLEYIQLIYFI